MDDYYLWFLLFFIVVFGIYLDNSYLLVFSQQGHVDNSIFIYTPGNKCSIIISR